MFGYEGIGISLVQQGGRLIATLWLSMAKISALGSCDSIYRLTDGFGKGFGNITSGVANQMARKDISDEDIKKTKRFCWIGIIMTVCSVTLVTGCVLVSMYFFSDKLNNNPESQQLICVLIFSYSLLDICDALQSVVYGITKAIDVEKISTIITIVLCVVLNYAMLFLFIYTGFEVQSFI